MKKLFLTFVFAISIANLFGATYTWKGGATGVFATAANWNPTRTTPDPTDILVFDGANIDGNNAISATIAVTGFANQSIGGLTVQNNNVTVTLDGATNQILTFASGTLTINSGNTLVMGSTNGIKIASSGTLLTCAISGILSVSIGSVDVIPMNVIWGTAAGTVKYTSVGNSRITPGTYFNLDGGATKFNFDTGSTSTGTFNIYGTLSTANTSYPQMSTFNFKGTNQTIPLTYYYNLDLSGASNPTFANGTLPFQITGTLTPGTATPPASSTFTFGTSGMIIASPQTIPALNYNNLKIDGPRGGVSALTGTTVSASPIISGLSTLTGIGFGGSISGTSIPANTYIFSTTASPNPTPTATWATSATTITVSSNTGIGVGMTVTGGTGIPANTSVTAISSNTITINNPTTAAQATATTVNFLPTATWATGATTILVSSTTNIALGMTVTGVTGIPANTRVTAINTTTKVVTLSNATTTDQSTALPVIFSGIITMSQNATATGSSSDIAISTGLTLAPGTIGVSGTYTDSHTGTITNMTSTGNTLNFTGTTAVTLQTGTYNNLTINNSASNTLNGNSTLNGVLTLTSGKLSLGANDLNLGTLGSISGGSATSYIVTNSTGKLIVPVAAATNTLIPIGASTTSYDPVTVNPATATAFFAKVSTTLTGTAASGIMYNAKEWNLASTIPSSTVVSFTPAAITATGNYPIIGNYVSGAYSNMAATLTGGTYTSTVSNFGVFVSGASDTATKTAVLNATELGIKMYSDHSNLIINGLNSGNAVSIYRINGQLMKSFTANSNQSVTALPTGVYLIRVIAEKGTNVQEIIL